MDNQATLTPGASTSRGVSPLNSAPGSLASSPKLALSLVTEPAVSPTWRPILTGPNYQVVLYNPTSHALVIRPASAQPIPALQHRQSPERRDESFSALCPMCGQRVSEQQEERAPDYFRLLAAAHDSEALPRTPTSESHGQTPGYFDRFFRVEKKLGMGASGAVFLVQHVIEHAELGRFAVKKIAVGTERSYLLDILQEVRLLETLHHPNIVTYHHSWLEDYQWSSFQRPTPTLHILMQWADGGSLDDLIDARIGGSANPADEDRAARIRAHRQRQQHRENTRAVHYFGADEVRSIFTDVAEGLGFLHNHSILHLDLKPGNVLLTYEDGGIIPRALLSDFGTSQDALRSAHVRTGNTGTLEYAAPETLSPLTPSLNPRGVHLVPPEQLPPLDSKADMWSLGMILYKMVFFRLPWTAGQPASDAVDQGLGPAPVRNADSGGLQAELEQEIRRYRGFTASLGQRATLSARGLPPGLVPLLESLLHISPRTRPTCERVLAAVRGHSHARPTTKQSNPSPPPSPTTQLVVRASGTGRGSTPPLLPAVEWSATASHQQQNLNATEDALLLPDLVPSASPDMPPRIVFALMAGQVARCGLLAAKIYALARAHTPPGVTALLAALASVDLWGWGGWKVQFGLTALHFAVLKAFEIGRPGADVLDV